MTPDELLRRCPREALRWLRARLGLSQEAFAERVDVGPKTVASWESGRVVLSPQSRRRLASLLDSHLATEEGAAFARTLGRGEAVDG